MVCRKLSLTSWSFWVLLPGFLLTFLRFLLYYHHAEMYLFLFLPPPHTANAVGPWGQEHLIHLYLPPAFLGMCKVPNKYLMEK